MPSTARLLKRPSRFLRHPERSRVICLNRKFQKIDSSITQCFALTSHCSSRNDGLPAFCELPCPLRQHKKCQTEPIPEDRGLKTMDCFFCKTNPNEPKRSQTCSSGILLENTEAGHFGYITLKCCSKQFGDRGLGKCSRLG